MTGPSKYPGMDLLHTSGPFKATKKVMKCGMRNVEVFSWIIIMHLTNSIIDYFIAIMSHCYSTPVGCGV